MSTDVDDITIIQSPPPPPNPDEITKAYVLQMQKFHHCAYDKYGLLLLFMWPSLDLVVIIRLS